MDQKNVEKCNVKISLFMGAEIVEPIGHLQRAIKFHVITNGLYVHAPNQLGYHCSWDWLMPVIEKISKIPIAAGAEDVCYPRTFGMPSPEGKPMFRFNCCGLFDGNTWIEAAWLAVADFVEQIKILNRNLCANGS